MLSYIKKGKLMTLDEIIEEAAREERELMEAWEEKMKDYHDFDNFLDDEVIRCNKCGANVLWNREYPKCEDYNAYRDERNAALRAKAGL
jgi:hypothetical protein